MMQIKRINPGDVLLELGGGANPIVHPRCLGGPDVNIDARYPCNNAEDKQCVDIQVDFNQPLPLADSEFDGVVSHFSLEHVSFHNVLQLLREVFRVCKPGAKVIFVVPNTEAQLAWIKNHPEGWDGKDLFVAASELLYGSQTYTENAHCAYFSPTIAQKLFMDAGFVQVKTMPYPPNERGTDLYIEAVKALGTYKEIADKAGVELSHEKQERVRQLLESRNMTPNDARKEMGLGPLEPTVYDPIIGRQTVEVKNETQPNAIIVQGESVPVGSAVRVVNGKVERVTPITHREQLFDRVYFNGGGKVGGYAREGYWDYPCLPPGELIIAEDGLRNIETLKEGELVMTHEGRFRPIMEVMKKPYKGKLITIHPRYAPAVRLTPEHPVFVVNIERKYKTWKPVVVSDPEWIPAGQVDVEKHWLVVPRPAISNMKSFDRSLLRLTGYFLSEGSTAKSHRGGGYVNFSFHKDELEYIEDVRSLMPLLFGCTSGSVCTRNNCSTVAFYSPSGKEYFSEYGTDCYSKKVPVAILDADGESMGELLIGLYRGDGNTTHKKHLRYNTVSRSMAVMIRLMLLRLGIVSALKWCPPRKVPSQIDGRPINSKGIWEICVSGKSYQKLAHILRLEQDQQNRVWKDTNKSYDFCSMDEKNVYVPIRSIKEESYKGMVYNFEVEEDHSYMHPGVALHNCHNVTVAHILARKPESVLELGAARGYILKRIQDTGVVGVGLEISKHCYMTRVCDGIVQKDICDGQAFFIHGWDESYRNFDLCYSVAVLEHIPEEHLPNIIKEMQRTCKRGLHGIDFHDTDHFDKTHCSIHPREWWVDLFAKHAPGWPVEIVDKEELERGQIDPKIIQGDGKVKIHMGSAWTMFHHGWINVDQHDLTQFAQQHGYWFARADLRGGFPQQPTGTVDLLFLHHVLEHLSYREALALLRECRRLLKPDTGAMRIVVPDTQFLSALYTSEDQDIQGIGNLSLFDFDEMSEAVANSPTAAAKYHALLQGDDHKSFWDAETLNRVLQESGFHVYLSNFREPSDHPGVVQILRETTEQTYGGLSIFCNAFPKVG